MRVQFDKQLETLNIELIKMGALCEDAISCAATYMLEGGKNLLEKVFQADSAIDRKEREIETICMRLLLQQPPGRLFSPYRKSFSERMKLFSNP